jgi:hypothetical protein
VVGGKYIVVLTGCAALAAAPSCALAQGGFTDYRQAAADQYPTQPPPANSGSGGRPGGAGNGQTGGSSGAPRPAHNPSAGHHGSSGHKPRNGSGVKSDTAAGGSQPVAVPTRPLHSAKGSLPFTGSDLSGLVVLALALIAAGFLLAGAERATRRRRAPA